MWWSMQGWRIFFFSQTKKKPAPAGENAQTILAAREDPIWVFVASVSQAKKKQKKSSAASSGGISMLEKFSETVRVIRWLIENLTEVWITDVCASKMTSEVTSWGGESLQWSHMRRTNTQVVGKGEHFLASCWSKPPLKIHICHKGWIKEGDGSVDV